MKETYLSRDFRETAAKFAVSVSQLIITTSKLVVCTGPIRAAYWLSP